MLPTHLLTAALVLFTGVSALDQAIDEDTEARPKGKSKGNGAGAGKKLKWPYRPRPRIAGGIKGECVSNAGNGLCVVIDLSRVKKIPCAGGTRKCTGVTRRPCTWHQGFADCT